MILLLLTNLFLPLLLPLLLHRLLPPPLLPSPLLPPHSGVVASTSWMLGGIGVMIGTQPFMAIILAAALTLYFFLYRFYRGTCVDLQRLYATTMSPIQGNENENGLY